MWILFALGASVFWGLTYVFNEEVYKKISVLTYLGVASLVVSIVMITTAYFAGTLKPDIETISSSKRLLGFVAGGIFTLLIAELFIGFSIVTKNATLSGLVEISYPIFIALFSYFLFRNHVTIQTIIGGVIIFSGIFVIYYFNH